MSPLCATTATNDLYQPLGPHLAQNVANHVAADRRTVVLDVRDGKCPETPADCGAHLLGLRSLESVDALFEFPIAADQHAPHVFQPRVCIVTVLVPQVGTALERVVVGFA